MNKELFFSEKKLKELFTQYGIYIKKEKGQNFLIDYNILRKLINAIGEDNEFILEIGSGPGNITIFLKDMAKRVVGIEVDRDFKPIHVDIEKRYPHVSFIYNDIRKIDILSIIKEEKVEKVKIVGNIPYYLSSFIIRKLYDWSFCLSEAIIMMPRDVASRVVASPNTKVYGILSVASQVKFKPEIMFYVKSGSFFPRPKIDSAVVKFTPSNIYKIDDEKLFFRILKITFGNRRKMLINTLKNIIPDAQVLKDLLNDLEIDPKSRPEILSVNDFVKLYEKLRYFS